MSKRIKIIFTLSLLLNVVLLGVGAGVFYRFCHNDIAIPGDLSPEARSFIARTFQEGREKVKPLISEVKARRSKVEDVLTADTFDSKAYNKTVSDMLDTRDKISRQRADIMGKALVDLPVADRKRFANRILDGLEGRKPKPPYNHTMMKGDKNFAAPPAADEKKP